MTQQVYREMFETMKSRGGVYVGADIPEFYALVGTQEWGQGLT